jgi:hypothetical protein
MFDANILRQVLPCEAVTDSGTLMSGPPAAGFSAAVAAAFETAPASSPGPGPTPLAPANLNVVTHL